MDTIYGDDGVDDSAYNDAMCPHGFEGDEECSWCDAWMYEEDDLRTCSCEYCHCPLRTINGEPCAHCIDGAHQG